MHHQIHPPSATRHQRRLSKTIVSPILIALILISLTNLLLAPPAAAVDSPYERDYCLETVADSLPIGKEITLVTRDGKSIAGSLEEVNKVDRIVRLSILQGGQPAVKDVDLSSVERIDYVHRGKPKWGLAFAGGVAGFLIGYALAGRFDSKEAHYTSTGQRLVYHDAWIPVTTIVAAAPFIILPMLPEHRTVECK